MNNEKIEHVSSTDNDDWLAYLFLFISIFIGFLLGFAVAYFHYDSKLTDKDLTIDNLKAELSLYTVTEDKLLPCPWCGSEDLDIYEIGYSGSDEWNVRCNECGFSGPIHYIKHDWFYDDYVYFTKEEAVDNWNKIVEDMKHEENN